MNSDLGAAAREEVRRGASNGSAWRAFGSRDIWPLVLVGVVAAFLCLPFIRFVHCLCSDEGIFLRGAELMLAGSKPYVDFFEFLPPGSFIITAAWFGMAGISMLSARSLAILTIVGIACFTYLACRQASKQKTLSVILAVGWLVMSLGPWMQVSHHWFTTLFSMIGLWATLAKVEQPQPRLRMPLIAGLAAGAAAMVTPTQGALVMLAGASAYANLRRYWSELIVYGLASTLIPISLLAYVISYGGLTDAFNDVILFPAARYGGVTWAPYAAETGWHNLPLKYLFPVTALLIVIVCVRSWRTSLQDRVLQSCAAFGLAGMIAIVPRPDIHHITFVAPLVLPLVAHCASAVVMPWLPRFRYAPAAIVIAVCMPLALSVLVKSHRALYGEAVVMPRGSVQILYEQDGGRQLAASIAAMPIDDGYFFYPQLPLVSFLTARRHVSRYDAFFPSYTLPSQYREACISATRRATWVVIDRNWTDLGNLRALFVAMPDTKPPETKRFEQALDNGFKLVGRNGPYEIRHRIESADDICANIAR